MFASALEGYVRLSHTSIALSAVFSLLAFTSSANADILVSINKSAQQMIVAVDGQGRYVWPVSTGAPGYDTPSGEFKPFRMEADHFSREWDDAPMPNSIFFTREGHAIHGSDHLKAIGTPASHGCVRLEPKNAAILFDLVKREGINHTRVVLIGKTPRANEWIARRATVRTSRSVTASAPREQAAHGWRQYHDDPRTYYYRGDTTYERRYYRSRGLFSFGW